MCTTLPSPGEACDDGNVTDDGEGSCVADCSAIQTCGDEVLQGTEQCDGAAPTFACDAACQWRRDALHAGGEFTCILFDGGQEVARHSGAMMAGDIEAWVNAQLSGRESAAH